MWVMRKDCYVNAAEAITSTIYGQGGRSFYDAHFTPSPASCRRLKINDFPAE